LTGHFPSDFGPLHTGQPLTVELRVDGAQFQSSHVIRDLYDLNGSFEPLADGKLIDTFAPYAVHIYQLQR
jgi:hypothetical protein